MKLPSNEDIRARIFELLSGVDGLNISPRELRERLSIEYGVDISVDKRDFVKECISSYVSSLADTENVAVKPQKKVPVSSRKVVKRTLSAKVLELSPHLAQFCKQADPLNPCINLAQVRSCILKYCTDNGLKQKTEIIFDESLSAVFPKSSVKKKIKIFQIFKCLKIDKAYTYWQYEQTTQV